MSNQLLVRILLTVSIIVVICIGVLAYRAYTAPARIEARVEKTLDKVDHAIDHPVETAKKGIDGAAKFYKEYKDRKAQ